MAKNVVITANPQGVDAVSVGLQGEVVKQYDRFALISFENEFGEQEQWYFTNTEFVEL